MSSLQYTLRPFDPNSTDIAAISDISALSNEHDELTRYMTRNIQSQWPSYRAHCCRWLKSMILKPGSVCWVVEERSPAQIVGWAIWSRSGSSSVARSWRSIYGNEGWGRRLERMLGSVEGMYYRWVPGVNPTMDQAHVRELMPVLNEEWPAEIFQEYWVLEALYVHPEHYRKGVGKMLARWGVERGQAEGTPVLVHSSAMGRNLYESVGFEVMKRMDGFDPYIPEFSEGGEGKGCWVMGWQYEGGDEVERCRKKYVADYVAEVVKFAETGTTAKEGTTSVGAVVPADALSVT